MEQRTVWSYPFGAPDGLRLHPRYAFLRAREPVARVKLAYGPPAWLVTGHADACTVLADPRFSRAPGRDEPRVGAGAGAAGGLIAMDPPDHTALRDTLADAFSPARVDRLRADAEAVANELLDKLTAGPADLLADYAVPLSLAAAANLLGIPATQRDRFGTWAGAIMSTARLARPQVGEYAARLQASLSGLLRERRREPAPDLLGAFARAGEDGRLTEAAQRGQAIGLLVLAFETTTAQLVDMVYTLQTTPGAWDRVCAEARLVPAAVEELMRYVPLSAQAAAPRFATEPVELDGATVRAGDPVLVSLAAANRDERVFADPERLDLDRQPNPHLGFGHGVHHCLGALLARGTLQVGLAALAARRPGLRLAGDVVWSTNPFARRPDALPVTLHDGQ